MHKSKSGIVVQYQSLLRMFSSREYDRSLCDRSLGGLSNEHHCCWIDPTLAALIDRDRGAREGRRVRGIRRDQWIPGTSAWRTCELSRGVGLHHLAALQLGPSLGRPVCKLSVYSLCLVLTSLT